MPSLGADMEAGTLVEWLKQPGDAVKHGDIIAVVETDKGAIEVEVFEDGELEELLVKEGSKVPVGTALAQIFDEGDAEPTVRPSRSEPELEPGLQRGLQAAPSPAPTPPRQPPTPALPGLRMSPAARLLAEARRVGLASVTGTGPGGAIVREDVAAMLELGREAAPAQKSDKVAPDLAPMRRAIAAAMAKSKREIPHYYLSHQFEISAAMEWLDAYNSQRPPPERLLLNVLLVKAVALAVRKFPEFNGFYRGDAFEPSEAIHVGNAIAIRGGGLAAPAIHNTDSLSLAELMDHLHDLVGRTRRGGFRSSEISDSTVTVSSLGERGVDALWPVIYPPQVAIIGFGAVQKRARALDAGLVVRPVLNVTLAADHRANDGHRGALLLRRISDLLTEPEAL